MKKELQDLAWSCLPKEFKEEVKKEYARCVAIDADDDPNLPAYIVGSAISRMALLEKLFGEHNLTSDAEGEEMLMVEKRKVQDVYKTSKDIVNIEQYGTRQYSIHTQIMCVLENLFGSKCLPDGNKECSNPSVVNCKHKHGDGTCSLSGMCCYKLSKPAEPKFKVGDVFSDYYSSDTPVITEVLSTPWGYVYCLDNQTDRIYEKII